MPRPRSDVFVVCAAAFAVLATAAPAVADSGPVIVIPSRPGVPVIINGRDVSYAVVEGDWGLSRPGAVPVTIIGRAPYVHIRRETRRNYPRYGVAPERGRNEVEPPADRVLPEPAESFSRSWSSSSDVTPPRPRPVAQTPMPSDENPAREPAQSYNAGPDTIPATITDPQTFNQPIIIAPQSSRGRRP